MDEGMEIESFDVSENVDTFISDDMSDDIGSIMDEVDDIPYDSGITELESETEASEIAEWMNPEVTEEINYDEVYEGLESYDFDGINVSDNPERLDASLENFESGVWENLSMDEQKDAMNGLAEYVEEVIGFDSPPEIVYYNNPEDGDYGGYSAATNTLEINEHMLYQNEEAADTVAHELWHAYQHQRAENPCTTKDQLYQYGFENYVSPEDDFTGYQEQLVEAEARAFAQQFKDRLNMGRRSS